MEVDLAAGVVAPLAVEAVPNGDRSGRRLRVDDFTHEVALVDSEEVQIEGMGTVVVHGFTKSEQRRLRKEAKGPDGEIDEDKLELLMFQRGLSDPALSVEQTQQAFDTWGAARIDTILAAITRVNGMTPGFAREQVATFREGS
jgi:hypothetical protein